MELTLALARDKGLWVLEESCQALVRSDFRQMVQNKHRKSVLVFVSPDLDPGVLHLLRHPRQQEYNVLGVVLDGDDWKLPLFHDLPVLGIRDELAVALDANDVREVFVALSQDTASSMAGLAAKSWSLALVRGLCQERNIPCRMLHNVLPLLHAQTQRPLNGEEMQGGLSVSRWGGGLVVGAGSDWFLDQHSEMVPLGWRR